MKIQTTRQNSVAQGNIPLSFLLNPNDPDDKFQVKIFSRVQGPVFFYLSYLIIFA